ncbi:hypothetical protein BP00DRAFT_121672 [Aspergillus indologenus CBS 114.80]|uniref:Uncharacterized protein n=1 Tax=Aspergillus indologenus CBS 114.80 TaxID=1450541 RepID=A0A2V5IBB7_9EURO|nr:hypothetical protein BP00DRAFT_121672 [Aspergillus indologenus CBS 114.80]
MPTHSSIRWRCVWLMANGQTDRRHAAANTLGVLLREWGQMMNPGLIDRAGQVKWFESGANYCSIDLQATALGGVLLLLIWAIECDVCGARILFWEGIEAKGGTVRVLDGVGHQNKP